MKRQSLFFMAPGKVQVREEDVPPLGDNQVGIQAIVSTISAGTELLVYRGEVPGGVLADDTLVALSGNLEYPMKYGYSSVGRVVALGESVEPGWKGKAVFAFNPHETWFMANTKDLLRVPEKVDAQDAAFMANAETAVNLVLDGNPRLGERVVVLGQGVVGLLATALLAAHPLETLITVDRFQGRRNLSISLGADHSLEDDRMGQALSLLGPRRADLVYELSGNPDSLDLALRLVGDEGRVVVGSWYGNKPVAIELGGRFHRGRIQVISSQVSRIAPALRGRWDSARRFEQAWSLLARAQPRQWVTHRFPLTQAAEAYDLLDKGSDDVLAVQFTLS